MTWTLPERLASRGLLAAATFAALTAAACAGEGTPGPQETVQDPAPGSGGGTAEGVAVTLTEWSVTSSAPNGQRDEITFSAINRGTMAHQLKVVKTERAADELELDGDLVDESTVEVVAGVEPFDPEDSRPITVELERGHYVLLCNVPGHYARGMRTDFSVN